jgi:lipopolysaccharide/colanic/teichoic acid biosynthesis glycosyltransferase
MSFVVHNARALREPLCRDTVSGIESASVSCARYFGWKGLISRFCGLLLLIPALPLTALLVLLVRLTSRGPGLYRQIRVGYQGKTFSLYKIRTMRSDAEAKTGPVWTEPNDPRITRLGRFLRRVHLDELPQLLNVIRGEMALIGPRPERPEFTQYLAREIPGYMDRYRVAPGITGLAQINLPPDTDLDSVRRKQVLDLEYIRTATPIMDLRIMVCTAARLFGLPGLRIAHWLGLERAPQIPGYMIRESSGNGVPATYGVRLNTASHAGPGKVASKKGGIPAA